MVTRPPVKVELQELNESLFNEDVPRVHRDTDIRYHAPEVQLGNIVQKDNKPDVCG